MSQDTMSTPHWFVSRLRPLAKGSAREAIGLEICLTDPKIELDPWQREIEVTIRLAD
jgi:hypothetical protein